MSPLKSAQQREILTKVLSVQGQNDAGLQRITRLLIQPSTALQKNPTVFKEPVTPERLIYMADLSHGYDGQTVLTITRPDQSHKHILTNQSINKPECTELTDDLGYVTDYSRDVKQPPSNYAAKITHGAGVVDTWRYTMNNDVMTP